MAIDGVNNVNRNVQTDNIVFQTKKAENASMVIPIGQSKNDPPEKVLEDKRKLLQEYKDFVKKYKDMKKPSMPAKLNTTTVSVKAKRGDTVSEFANYYLCTEKDIYDKNPNIDKNFGLREGNTYIIPTVSEEERTQYHKAYNEYIEIQQKVILYEWDIPKLEKEIKKLEETLNSSGK